MFGPNSVEDKVAAPKFLDTPVYHVNIVLSHNYPPILSNRGVLPVMVLLQRFPVLLVKLIRFFYCYLFTHVTHRLLWMVRTAINWRP